MSAIDDLAARLGVVAPVSLATAYRAWVEHVPFDNVVKRIALADAASPFPNGESEEFAHRWLEDGAGGTCWPSANALCVYLRHLGFDAERQVATMEPVAGVPRGNHGTVVVRTEDGDVLCDTAIATDAPLPLEPGASADGARVEARGDHLVVVWTPRYRPTFPCAIDGERGVGEDGFRRRYERTRAGSPFNATLHARVRRGAGVVTLFGSSLHDGETWCDVDRGECLTTMFGMSTSLVDKVPPDDPPANVDAAVTGVVHGAPVDDLPARDV